MIRARALHLAALASTLAAAGHSLVAAPAGPAPGSGDARRGRVVFARACAACHGLEGHGDGPAARQLDPRPRDLTTQQYRFRSTPTGSLPLPADLERTIRDGLPGTAMPGFRDIFSAEQLADLIAFLYSLQPPEVLERALPAPVEPGPIPEPTAEVVHDGRALYYLSGCWRCHGARGRGDGPSARGLVDESERPIRAPDVRHDPLKRGRAPADVVRILRTGLNGAPMPSYDEAMLVARDDPADTVGLEELLSAEELSSIEAFRSGSPSREELSRMSEAERAALRDERLGALAQYVLSLGHRRGPYAWLLVERPERERRSAP